MKPRIDEFDQYGWAPLHILAQNKDHAQEKCDMIRLLCEARADVNIRGNRGATPLFKAASTSALGQLEALLNCRADPNTPNNEGTTALDATWHNNEVYEFLYRRGGEKGKGVTGKGRPRLRTNTKKSTRSKTSKNTENKKIIKV